MTTLEPKKYTDAELALSMERGKDLDIRAKIVTTPEPTVEEVLEQIMQSPNGDTGYWEQVQELWEQKESLVKALQAVLAIEEVPDIGHVTGIEDAINHGRNLMLSEVRETIEREMK